MDTTKSAHPSAVAQAVATLTKGKIDPVKSKAPSAGRRIKDQGPTLDTKLIVTKEGARTEIKGASSAQAATDKRWSRGSDILWMLGYRADDLIPLDGDDLKVARKRPEFKGRKAVYSEKGEEVLSWIIEGFHPKIQKLLALPILALDEYDKSIRGEWQTKSGVYMGYLINHLRKHEENEKGPREKTSLAESIVKILKTQKDRIKSAKADKIDFNDKRVIELIDETIAELT